MHLRPLGVPTHNVVPARRVASLTWIGSPALIAVGGLGGTSAPRLPRAARLAVASAPTVEGTILSTSAILAAVIRGSARPRLASTRLPSRAACGSSAGARSEDDDPLARQDRAVAAGGQVPTCSLRDSGR